MSTQIIRRRLPSGLYIDRMVFDDGDVQHRITRKGTSEWDRGMAVVITKEEYDALFPLSKEGLE